MRPLLSGMDLGLPNMTMERLYVINSPPFSLETNFKFLKFFWRSFFVKKSFIIKSDLLSTLLTVFAFI